MFKNFIYILNSCFINPKIKQKCLDIKTYSFKTIKNKDMLKTVTPSKYKYLNSIHFKVDTLL
jgi:hypothetical protein